MRFFHKNARAGGPVGRSVNGGRFFFRFPAVECQWAPARTAVILSAILRDNSTEASSKATSDFTTHA